MRPRGRTLCRAHGETWATFKQGGDSVRPGFDHTEAGVWRKVSRVQAGRRETRGEAAQGARSVSQPLGPGPRGRGPALQELSG